MCKVLENSLFVKDKKKYKVITECVTRFNSLYNKNNIIRDDIFNILENYVTRHDMPFSLLRYPIKDKELCACTFIRKGCMFVMVNSDLPLSKQIFAAAHELYHIYCYLEENDPVLLQTGSILESNVLDDAAKEVEDMEANAFAGLLLAPPDRIDEQMRIYGIKRGEISLQDVLMLMEIFAIPYKAIVLRLFEDGIISEAEAREFFTMPQKEILDQIELTGKAARWQQIPQTPIRLGSLMEKMKAAEDLESVREERMKDDLGNIKRIKERIAAQ